MNNRVIQGRLAKWEVWKLVSDNRKPGKSLVITSWVVQRPCLRLFLDISTFQGLVNRTIFLYTCSRNPSKSQGVVFSHFAELSQSLHFNLKLRGSLLFLTQLCL